MNSSSDPDREAEAARVGRVYGRYRASRRRRRAWAAENPGNQAIREELLAAVLEEAGAELAGEGAVLDIGCGTGYWLEALRAAGVEPARLTGVDILADRVQAAARRVPGAAVRRADARSLPFEDESFGLVLLFTVLSSLATRAEVHSALAEARRMLRPSGVMLCYELRLPSPFNPRARRISSEDFDAAGIRPRQEGPLTVLPPLARRLGARTGALYPRLARLPLLQSHRLVVYREPTDERPPAGRSAA
ncbi:MAG: class I SAM-dependent methyltransferase [Thermoleophilaceae bacterium]